MHDIIDYEYGWHVRCLTPRAWSRILTLIFETIGLRILILISKAIRPRIPVLIADIQIARFAIRDGGFPARTADSIAVQFKRLKRDFLS